MDSMPVPCGRIQCGTKKNIRLHMPFLRGPQKNTSTMKGAVPIRHFNVISSLSHLERKRQIQTTSFKTKRKTVKFDAESTQ